MRKRDVLGMVQKLISLKNGHIIFLQFQRNEENFTSKIVRQEPMRKAKPGAGQAIRAMTLPRKMDNRKKKKVIKVAIK